MRSYLPAVTNKLKFGTHFCIIKIQLCAKFYISSTNHSGVKTNAKLLKFTTIMPSLVKDFYYNLLYN